MSADRVAAEGLLEHLARPNDYSKQFLSSTWPSWLSPLSLKGERNNRGSCDNALRCPK